MHNRIARRLKKVIGASCSSLLICIGLTLSPVLAEDYTISTGSGAWEKKSDDLYTMDIDGDGKVDVTLTKNGDKWTYQFNVSKASQDYYIYEEMMNELAEKGYTSSGSDGSEGNKRDPGVVKGSEGKTTFTLTNSKEHTKKTYGSLKLTKKITDADGNVTEDTTSFSFTITLSGDTDALKKEISGNKTFGDIAFKDGVAKVTLANKSSVTIKDLPTGIKYSISEDTVEGYQTSWTGQEGYIVADTTSNAVCTNLMNIVLDSSPGSFKIKQTIDAIDEDKGNSYTYHVEIGNVPGQKEFTYTITDSDGNTKSYTYNAKSDGTATVDVSLKEGEIVEFENLPKGTTYQITEDAGDFISSYTTKQNSPSATIAKTSDSNDQSDRSLTTALETVDENEDVTFTFDNAYQYTQSLKITKRTAQQKLIGSGELDSSKKFEFTIVFTDMEENSFFNSTIGTIRADEDGEATKTFTIQNGESVEFTNMPVGVKYTITESAHEDWLPTYIFTDTKAVVTSEADGEDSKALSTAEETVDRGENCTVTFTNMKPTRLPKTGGIGLIIIVVTGAGIWFFVKKKKEKGDK